MPDPAITLFHMPRTRSLAPLILLEELGVPYHLEALNRERAEHRAPAFLAINPLGKVPALRDAAGAIVTEQVAIMLHLADLFPAAGLAPALGDPLRGPYLRWMVFYAATFEPAVVDRASGRDPGPRAMSPYGDFDAMLETVVGAITPGPYVLGARFSAADVLWGTALAWTTAVKLLPQRPEIADYAQRIGSRPAAQRASAKDKALLAA